MNIPSSMVQGPSSWTCHASCAPSGAAFPNNAVGLIWEGQNTACSLLLVPKGLNPMWASYLCGASNGHNRHQKGTAETP